jgi:hypothetical protein
MHILIPSFILGDVKRVKQNIVNDIIAFKASIQRRQKSLNKRNKHRHYQKQQKQLAAHDRSRDDDLHQRESATAQLLQEQDNSNDTTRSFNAAKYLFVSSRLARLFPALPESYIVAHFKTQWPKKSFKVSEKSITKSYNNKLSFIAQAMSRVLLFCLTSVVQLPEPMQDVILQLVSTSGFGYLILLLMQAWAYSPSLVGVIVFAIGLIVHFLTVSNKKSSILPAMLTSSKDKENEQERKSASNARRHRKHARRQVEFRKVLREASHHCDSNETGADQSTDSSAELEEMFQMVCGYDEENNKSGSDDDDGHYDHDNDDSEFERKLALLSSIIAKANINQTTSSAANLNSNILNRLREVLEVGGSSGSDIDVREDTNNNDVDNNNNVNDSDEKKALPFSPSPSYSDFHINNYLSDEDEDGAKDSNDALVDTIKVSVGVSESRSASASASDIISGSSSRKSSEYEGDVHIYNENNDISYYVDDSDDDSMDEMLAQLKQLDPGAFAELDRQHQHQLQTRRDNRRIATEMMWRQYADDSSDNESF